MDYRETEYRKYGHLIRECLENGLRQIPHLDEVRKAIEADACCLSGAVVDFDTGFT